MGSSSEISTPTMAETKPTCDSAICEAKKNEEVGFVDNMKNTLCDFTQTSMASLKKVYDNWKIDISFGGGNLVEEPVSPSKAVEDRRFQAFDVFQ